MHISHLISLCTMQFAGSFELTERNAKSGLESAFVKMRERERERDERKNREINKRNSNTYEFMTMIDSKSILLP